ncbi:MAG: caspase domain-containing protein [Gammaproteobacteria bacterium]
MSIRLPLPRLYLAALLCALTANVFAEDSRTLAASRTAAPASERKVALVIGNAAYRENPLRNPVNDARAMSAKLKKLGFEVITHENVTALKYGAVLREFRSKLSPGAVALFFYAGHGLQVNGKNYLPAVDAQIQGEEDVPMQSLDLNQVLLTLEDSKTRMNLVFLDACRNNPYARSFRSAAGGLARVEAPSGTLISYATRPGSVAADGTGANGLYTTQLLKHMDARGQPVEQVLKRVVGGVSDASRGAQEPWMEGSIRGDFYFVPGAATATTQGTDTAIPTLEQDNQLWAETKQAGTLEAYQWYLEKFPDGLRAGLARGEIAKLESRQAPAPNFPSPTSVAATTCDRQTLISIRTEVKACMGDGSKPYAEKQKCYENYEHQKKAAGC